MTTATSILDNFSALRLRAKDDEDLQVIAAVIQDSVLPISEMKFLQEDQQFIIVLNRFCWEITKYTTEDIFVRTNSGICFENVAAVKVRGLNLKKRDLILDLLTMSYKDGVVILSFAGNRDIKLEMTALDCRLDDFGEPWLTKVKPQHIPADAWNDWNIQ